MYAHQANEWTKKTSAICRQAQIAVRLGVRTFSRSTSSTGSLVNGVRGPGDAQGIIDTVGADWEAMLPPRGERRLLSSLLEWSGLHLVGGFQLCLNKGKRHRFCTFMGDFVDPFLVPNLTSHQVQKQQLGICHTPSWPSIPTCNLSLMRWQRPTICKECIKAYRRGHPLMALLGGPLFAQQCDSS
jgi:hypothetical protein